MSESSSVNLDNFQNRHTPDRTTLGANSALVCLVPPGLWTRDGAVEEVRVVPFCSLYEPGHISSDINLKSKGYDHSRFI